MTRPEIPISELRRLYLAEGLAVREIAARFNCTRQNVHWRLKNDGVKFVRQRGRKIVIGEELLKRLYVEEGLSAAKISTRTGYGQSIIYTHLEWFGIERRGRGSGRRKYPELDELKMGESMAVARPTYRGKVQSCFYPMARRAGIKVSVKTLDERTFLLTRVA